MLHPEPTGSVREDDQTGPTVLRENPRGTDRTPADLETFIIIHDQDPLLQLYREKAFSNLGLRTYLSWVSRPTDPSATGRTSSSRVCSRTTSSTTLTSSASQCRTRSPGTAWRLPPCALLEYDVKVAAELERVTLT